MKWLADVWALLFRRYDRIWRAHYPDGLVSAKVPYDEAKNLVGVFGGKVVRAR